LPGLAQRRADGRVRDALDRDVAVAPALDVPLLVPALDHADRPEVAAREVRGVGVAEDVAVPRERRFAGGAVPRGQEDRVPLPGPRVEPERAEVPGVLVDLYAAAQAEVVRGRLDRPADAAHRHLIAVRLRPGQEPLGDRI